MATIDYKLKEITSEYSLFRDNQVLTADQLNEIVNYFEDQQRLSRILLTGVGRICGFDVEWEPSEGLLRLSHGVGVTTDGDLMYFGVDQEFTQYRLFEDDSARYEHFHGISEFYELFPADTSSDITGLNDLADFPSPGEYALILYIENYGKSPDTCTKLDCDNQGDRQVANIHALLIKKSDLQSIIDDHDTLFQQCHRAGTKFFELPKITVGRVILNDVIAGSYKKLYDAYRQLIVSKAEDVKNAVDVLLTGFKTLLDPKDLTSTENWDTLIDQRFGNIKDLFIQYRYDLLKDVVDTYAELRVILWDLCVQCCPDLNAFPKHLMIRELVVDSAAAQPVYRHGFYPSPAVTDQQDKIDEARMLYQRMHRLMADYDTSFEDDIKAVPSRLPVEPLGNRAIPAYLKETLRDAWYARTTKYQRQEELLGYRSIAPQVDSVKPPLSDSLDKYDFFRIEGHIGSSFNTALSDVTELIKKYQLPIQVVGLRLGAEADSIDIDEYECYFEDLLVIMRAWAEEQRCVWSSVGRYYSGFSVINPEQHIAYSSKLIYSYGNMAGMRTSGLEEAYDPKTPSKSIRTTEAESESVKDYEFYAANPIEENLVKSEGYLGKYFAEEIAANPNASYLEIASSTQDRVEKLDRAEWSSDQSWLLVEIPTYLLAISYTLNQNIPQDLSAVNDNNINPLTQSFDELCQGAKLLQRLIPDRISKSDYVRRGYEERYQQLINLLIENCCAIEKLQDVHEEIQRRKRKLLSKTMFSNFVKEHPGLEHMAGVPKGGTFVMVYQGGGSGEQQVKNEILMEKDPKRDPMTREKLRAEKERRIIKEKYSGKTKNITTEKYLNDELLLALKSKDFEKAAKIMELIRGDQEIRLEADIARYQVVADFALPYLCCSDCPPMQFVVPKEKVSLLIPAHICYTPGMDPVIISVTPANGEVKTDKGENLVSKDENGRWVFDPSKVTTELFGQTIGFTVNDQITDVTTVVIEEPQPQIELVQVDCYVEKGYAEAIFRNNTTNISGIQFDYEWSFGDGSPIDTTRSNTVTHQYLGVEPDVTQTFEVRLKATNTLCSATSDPVVVTVLCPSHDEPDHPNANCEEVNKLRFSEIKDELERLPGGDLPRTFRAIYKDTTAMIKEIEADYDAVVKGANNEAIMRMLFRLFERTLSQIPRASAVNKEILSRIFGIQFMTMLVVIRCQEDPEVDRLKEGLGVIIEMLQQIQESYDVDPEGHLADYIDEFLGTTSISDDELKQLLTHIMDILKG